MITRQTFEDAAIGLCMLKYTDVDDECAHILFDFSYAVE